MNTMDLLELIGETPERYVLDAGNVTAKKLPAKRIWLVAAIMTALALLVGCVAYVLNLNDLVLFEETYENQTGETEPRTVISLQGISGSKAYMAAKEWLEWKQTYDPEMELFSEEACEVFPEEYQPYTIYTQEMKDKLDQICQKYDVQLMGQSYYDTDNAYIWEALQIDGICHTDTSVQTDTHIRYVYTNGSFAANCTITFDEELWPEPLWVDVTCYHKDAFHEVVLSVTDFEDYKQWNYTTTDGKETLLALGSDKALIFAQTGDWFFAVTGIDTKAGNVLDGEYTMSKEVLETIANAFDFKVQPKAPSEEYFAQAAERQKAEEEQRQEALDFEQSHKEWIGAASFEKCVSFHLENDEKAAQMGYMLKDLDGNGTEELLIGYDGYIYHIYSEQGGEAYGILGWNNRYPAYLAEDGTLVVSFEFRTEGVYLSSICNFYHIENGIEVIDIHLEHNPEYCKDTESPWWLTYADRKSRPITEEEYTQIITSKKYVPLDMLPLTEYPMQK